MSETFELIIPYEEKDSVKEKHNLTFRQSTRKWEYNGDFLPDDLKQYKCVDVHIPYQCKDELKQIFCLQWNTEKKTWQTNMSTYNKLNQHIIVK